MISQALHIFRKDLRRLWPFVLLWIALAAFLFLWRPVDYFYRPWDGFAQRLHRTLEMLLPFSWLLLIAQLIHQEALPGSTQFWLSRPYDRRALLLAKALFLAVTIFLPLWILDALCLMRNGFSPWPYQGAILSRHAVLLLAVFLPGLMLASLTRTLGEFALSALGCFTAFTVITDLLRGHDDHWGQLGWVSLVTGFAVLILFTLGITAWQYLARRTRPAIAGAILGALGVAILPNLIPWSTAMAIQTSRSTAAPRALKFRQEGEALPESQNYARANNVLFRIPLGIDGLDDRDLVSHRMRLRLNTTQYDWTPMHLLGRREDGRHQIAFDLPLADYQRFRAQPVTLHWEAYVTTYRPIGDQRKPVSLQSSPVDVAGRCVSQDYRTEKGAQFQVNCLQAEIPRDRLLVRTERHGEPLMSWRLWRPGDVSPLALGGFLPVIRGQFSWRTDTPGATDMIIRRMRAESSFDTQIHLDNIALDAFRAGRIN